MQVLFSFSPYTSPETAVKLLYFPDPAKKVVILLLGLLRLHKEAAGTAATGADREHRVLAEGLGNISFPDTWEDKNKHPGG